MLDEAGQAYAAESPASADRYAKKLPSVFCQAAALTQLLSFKRDLIDCYVDRKH